MVRLPRPDWTAFQSKMDAALTGKKTRSKGQRGATRVTYPSGVTQIEEAPGRLWLVQWTEKPRRLRGGKSIHQGWNLRCTEPAGFVARATPPPIANKHAYRYLHTRTAAVGCARTPFLEAPAAQKERKQHQPSGHKSLRHIAPRRAGARSHLGLGLTSRDTPRQKAALDRPRRLAAIESPARCVVYAHAQRGARRRSLATGDKRASEALCVGVDRPAVSVAAAQVQLSQRGAAAQRREGAGDSARRQVIIVVPLDEEPFEGREEGGGVCGRHVQRAVVGEARRGNDAGRKSIDIRPPSA